MKLQPMIKGTLVKRYKRFLADIRLEDGTVVTAHCPNSGSMKSCLEEGAIVYCSPVDDPARKTKYTWEMIRIGGSWVGINTGIPNRLAFDWIREGIIPGFAEYEEFRREVKWEDSRFDIYMKNDRTECFVEVKNVTLRVGDTAMFPDAVTTRGRKHLETLIRVKRAGIRAVMLYFVQRSDILNFSPAREIDPDYADALDRAQSAGVEVMVVQAVVTPERIIFDSVLEFV
ncbi:MAG: DNA/RNA nuclease SfsA [Bacteroidales bacterium]